MKTAWSGASAPQNGFHGVGRIEPAPGALERHVIIAAKIVDSEHLTLLRRGNPARKLLKPMKPAAPVTKTFMFSY